MQPIRWFVVILVFLVSAGAGEAAEGELQYPLSLALSQENDIFVADREYHGVWRLRSGKLDSFSQGTKSFRTPLYAIRCVTLDRDGKLLAGDSATREIYRFNDQGVPTGLTRAADGKAAGASFGRIGMPMDIAVAANGELYVSDLELHRIVKVPSAGGDPSQFVAISAPRGMCWDGSGNLWIISGRQLVKATSAGQTTTVVGDGVFSFPHTVAIGTDGTAYVCDGYAKTIWKIPPSGKPEKWVSGAPLMGPVGMRMLADKVYVADPQAKAIFQITSDGKVTTLISHAKP